MPAPSIFLLVSSEDQIPQAHGICTTLSEQFRIEDVIIRSLSLPSEELLAVHNHRSVLWVVLEDDDFDKSDRSHAALLLRESPFPMVSVNAHDFHTASLTIAKWCSLASPTTIVPWIKQALLQNRQGRLVQDALWRTKSPYYKRKLEHAYDHLSMRRHHGFVAATIDKNKNTLSNNSGHHPTHQGKVRDCYDVGNDDTLLMVTTDRQSGFDRHLGMVPLKGAVLNLVTAFWMERTTHIIPNHLIKVPHPTVSLVKKCKAFTVEFVVRAYLTGSTSTAIWTHYQKGTRSYCGHSLPDGMRKNQKLWKPLLTPTTKDAKGDRPLSLNEIVQEKRMTQDDVDACAKAALALFDFGQELAEKAGLILVDTKYEFGKDKDGKIMLIDEVHTPDSSRYWLASSYKERLAQELEPESIDKEFFRLWFKEQCDPYKDQVLPQPPRELVLELSRRYIQLYEMITAQPFPFGQEDEDDDETELEDAIATYVDGEKELHDLV